MAVVVTGAKKAEVKPRSLEAVVASNRGMSFPLLVSRKGGGVLLVSEPSSEIINENDQS
jgi:hypothetical protein